MPDIYNTVLDTYRDRLPELPDRGKFHFASRLYLWQQLPESRAWLAAQRTNFIMNDDPEHTLQQLAAQPIPSLGQTKAMRDPYFAKYPQLRRYERCLFRLLFMHTIYGLDTCQLFFLFFDRTEVMELRGQLLEDAAALAYLSTFAINFLLLLDRFVLQDEVSLPLDKLLVIGKTSYSKGGKLENQLRCYFYTHCIIADSLFYFRDLPAASRSVYLQMLSESEELIAENYESLKLDNKLELLVCSRILGVSSGLAERIYDEAAAALEEGYIVEPRRKQRDTFQRAEHRNVLFLMSQRSYSPLAGTSERAKHADKLARSN